MVENQNISVPETRCGPSCPSKSQVFCEPTRLLPCVSHHALCLFSCVPWSLQLEENKHSKGISLLVWISNFEEGKAKDEIDQLPIKATCVQRTSHSKAFSYTVNCHDKLWFLLSSLFYRWGAWGSREVVVGEPDPRSSDSLLLPLIPQWLICILNLNCLFNHYNALFQFSILRCNLEDDCSASFDSTSKVGKIIKPILPPKISIEIKTCYQFKSKQPPWCLSVFV